MGIMNGKNIKGKNSEENKKMKPETKEGLGLLNKESPIDTTCPFCGVSVEKPIHILWQYNLDKKKADIKKGRKDFMPYGQIKCGNCDNIVYVHLIGDLEGFTSYVFKDGEEWKTFGEALKYCVIKLGKEFGHADTRAIRLSLAKLEQERIRKLDRWRRMWTCPHCGKENETGEGHITCPECKAQMCRNCGKIIWKPNFKNKKRWRKLPKKRTIEQLRWDLDYTLSKLPDEEKKKWLREKQYNISHP